LKKIYGKNGSSYKVVLFKTWKFHFWARRKLLTISAILAAEIVE
jgi:hypothetical protein